MKRFISFVRTVSIGVFVGASVGAVLFWGSTLTHPALSFETSQIDLSESPIAGETVYVPLVLKNNRWYSMVANVHATCGCTAIRAPSGKPIADPFSIPGRGSVVMMAEITTDGIWGEKSIRVFAGTVRDSRDCVANITMSVRGSLRPDRISVHFEEPKKGATKFVEFFDMLPGVGDRVTDVGCSLASIHAQYENAEPEKSVTNEMARLRGRLKLTYVGDTNTVASQTGVIQITPKGRVPINIGVSVAPSPSLMRIVPTSLSVPPDANGMGTRHTMLVIAESCEWDQLSIRAPKEISYRIKPSGQANSRIIEFEFAKGPPVDSNPWEVSLADKRGRHVVFFVKPSKKP